MDDNWNIKLCDFGFARAIESREKTRMTMCGSPYFNAPELLLGKAYNEKADVFAFGILLCESKKAVVVVVVVVRFLLLTCFPQSLLAQQSIWIVWARRSEHSLWESFQNIHLFCRNSTRTRWIWMVCVKRFVCVWSFLSNLKCHGTGAEGLPWPVLEACCLLCKLRARETS